MAARPAKEGHAWTTPLLTSFLGRHQFLIYRLFSLAGIVPVGGVPHLPSEHQCVGAHQPGLVSGSGRSDPLAGISCSSSWSGRSSFCRCCFTPPWVADHQRNGFERRLVSLHDQRSLHAAARDRHDCVLLHPVAPLAHAPLRKAIRRRMVRRSSCQLARPRLHCSRWRVGLAT